MTNRLQTLSTYMAAMAVTLAFGLMASACL